MESRLSLLVLAVTTVMAGGAHAAVIDTYTRADGSPATDSIGQTEVGGFDYVERGNSAAATTPNGTAEIAGGELQVYGRLGSTSNDTGGVFLSGYSAPDLTLSADVRFVHSIAEPTSTEQLANTLFVALRSQSAMTFGTSASDHGLIGVEIGPNGDVLVRENRNGTLATVYGANPFTGGTNTRRRTAGNLPATFNGLPFDTDQDGFIDDSETFKFGVELTGTQLKLFVNGAQIGSDMVVEATEGLNGDGFGLHKNRVASAFVTASDLFIDNLDVTPIPEPASLSALAASGLLLARRRRRAVRTRSDQSL